MLYVQSCKAILFGRTQKVNMEEKKDNKILTVNTEQIKPKEDSKFPTRIKLKYFANIN